MICLAPKLYYCISDIDDLLFGNNGIDKFSCKGTQKKNNVSIINFNNYKKCLDTNESLQVENTGMRYTDGSVVWYSQTKTGLTCKYNKRHLLEDRITMITNKLSYIFI